MQLQHLEGAFYVLLPKLVCPTINTCLVTSTLRSLVDGCGTYSNCLFGTPQIGQGPLTMDQPAPYHHQLARSSAVHRTKKNCTYASVQTFPWSYRISVMATFDLQPYLGGDFHI